MKLNFGLNRGSIAMRHFVRSAVFLLVIVVAGCSQSPSPVDFTVQTDDGLAPISKFRGDVVYLDFWATWCGPCRDSFPWMKEMQAKYKDKGLKVVAVSLDTDHALARQFADELSSNFLIGYDDTGAIADLFEVKGMPTSVIIDRDGTVAEIHQGFKLDKVDTYEKSLVKVLN